MTIDRNGSSRQSGGYPACARFRVRALLLPEGAMRRLILTALTATAIVLAVPAGAQTAADRIVAQLRGQGFEDIAVTTTLLGRVQIIAREDDTRREIILNPATGAILRDYWTDIDDDGKRKRKRKGKDDYLLDSDDDKRRKKDDD
ncbi:hypothetical protein [uncultured Roseovarius sp.]|uniref:hypothetical protein n=1 Tax=uncultured Roseovarius sp. TaxID=293344 RepID=UPI000C4FB1B7|nr:hypothetical protein [Roseovarius sp.]MBD11785.1 hypothetical protein [Roseovarius sp.]|tara:strand:- start:2436 stop:2870 length:435 start_codon:yes stop_codon:yes gene_type:complete